MKAKLVKGSWDIRGVSGEGDVTVGNLPSRHGKKLVLTANGAMISVPVKSIKAFMEDSEVKRLRERVAELEYERQLNLAEIIYQRRVIDMLMEGK